MEWYLVVPLWIAALSLFIIQDIVRRFMKQAENAAEKRIGDAVEKLVNEKIESWAKD